MVTYYLNNDVFDPAWVDTEAEKAAKSFSPGEKNGLTASQLRKFYNDVKTLERKWLNSGANDAAFTKVLPLIKLLKAKANYAWKRNVVPESFRKWLCDHVDSVNDSRDFRVFLLHFEAVVGFSYGVADKPFN